MMRTNWFFVALLTFIGVAAYHRFGWEGLAIPPSIWLLMPYRPG